MMSAASTALPPPSLVAEPAGCVRSLDLYGVDAKKAKTQMQGRGRSWCTSSFNVGPVCPYGGLSAVEKRANLV